MENRSSYFFTLIGVGKINFLEFTTKIQNVSNLVDDSMKFFNTSYNHKNITEALRNNEHVWVKSAKNRDSLLEYLKDIQIWSDNVLFYKDLQKTHVILRNDTNHLLRKAFDLREKDTEGAQQSLEISLEVSFRASLTLNESLEFYKKNIKDIIFDIKDKIANFSNNGSSFDQSTKFIPFETAFESSLGRLKLNASISELNRIVCGSFSLTCENNKCGAFQCGQCGLYEEKLESVYKHANFIDNSEETCANGMQSSFKRLLYFNDSFFTLYDKKEAQLKGLIKLVTHIFWHNISKIMYLLNFNILYL